MMEFNEEEELKKCEEAFIEGCEEASILLEELERAIRVCFSCAEEEDRCIFVEKDGKKYHRVPYGIRIYKFLEKRQNMPGCSFSLNSMEHDGNTWLVPDVHYILAREVIRKVFRGRVEYLRGLPL